MKILVITGTVREGRQTSNVAENVAQFLSKHHEVQIFDLKQRDIPHMRKRLSQAEEPPKDVEAFAQMVEESDVITVVSPEYNHSIPGPLKNILDYLYPEYKDRIFTYVTVSRGGFGGLRALSHLHDITIALGGLTGPSMPVSNVDEHFTEDEVSEEYQEKMERFLEQVEDYHDKFGQTI